MGAVGPAGPAGATGPAGAPASPAIITLLARNNFSKFLRACSQPGNGATGDFTYCNEANLTGWVVNWFTLDLSHADLTNADLSGGGGGGNFQSVNFSFAKLTNVNFNNGNLQGPDFSFADLTGATFTGANKQSIVFLYTICPDGSNSGPSGGTCALP
jgi:uncharacterized protein YjbI with pentapeptide repeats